MATEIELEKTYLAGALPAGLAQAKSEVIIDCYMPMNAAHPVIRLRQRGDRYELTKKVPISGNDSSQQYEHTIPLTSEEYAVFEKLPAKRLAKRRHYLKIDGHAAEVDVYQGDLAGLVVIDFEFATTAELEAFTAPDICIADVTQDKFVAAGMLAGKTYADIAANLTTYNYSRLTSESILT